MQWPATALYQNTCRQWRKLRRAHGRRAVASWALVVYLLASTGLPLPQVVRKDTSVPFPCAERKCGCRSAAQCFSGCCCFTREQRLAWGVKHGVRVSPDMLAASTSAPRESKPIRSCCQKRCERVTVEYTIGFEARKCQGEGTEWLALGVVSLPALPVEWSALEPCIAWLTCLNVAEETPLDDPPVPPPRLG